MSKHLYTAATVIAVTAAAGWATGNPLLASWCPETATMKPTTAILGALVGAISYTKSRNLGVLLALGAIITLVAGPVIPSFGDKGLLSQAPGVPSNMTLFLYGMIGMDMAWTRVRGADPLSRWTATTVLVVAALCLTLGYGLDVTEFRYSGGEGLGTEMAVPTAMMFLLFATGRMTDEPTE